MRANRFAECDYDPSAQTATLIREYIWMDGRAVGVIEGGTLYYVRTDWIGRPSFATNSSGTKVWEATYLPFGGVHTSTGTPLELRFPGQWFQSESGLHQNWMRDYDPTTGRYIQADPLGLVDGASVYGYVRQNPVRYVDPRGEKSIEVSVPWPFPPGPLPGPKDWGNAGQELLDWSHKWNPIDLALQWCVAQFKEPEKPERPSGPNRCTLMYTDNSGLDMQCAYACQGPPPYWNIVHVPKGAQCPITYWD